MYARPYISEYAILSLNKRQSNDNDSVTHSFRSIIRSRAYAVFTSVTTILFLLFVLTIVRMEQEILHI